MENNMEGFSGGGSVPKGFIAHMTNFDDNTKNTLLNITQYIVIAIIPLIIINKTMQRYVPKEDDAKNSIEIAGEILLQVLFIFIGIFFIHRFIIYFPTYSGKSYADLETTTSILGVLIAFLSTESKLGNKVEILSSRVSDLWNGETTKQEDSEEPKKRKPKGKLLPRPVPIGEENDTFAYPQASNSPQQPIYVQPEQDVMAANELLNGGFSGVSW